MSTSKEQIGNLRKYLEEELIRDPPNAPQGIKFRNSQMRRIVIAMARAWIDQVRDFRTIFFKYYGLGGVSLEKAFEYAEYFAMGTRMLKLNSWYVADLDRRLLLPIIDVKAEVK